MRRFSSDVDAVPGVEEIEAPAAVAVACEEIHGFLTDVLIRRKTDVIISTLRKGSWIIDDFLKIRDLKILHYTNKELEKIPYADLSDKNVLVFDDSIHSGDSVNAVLSKVRGHRNICVGCIAINEEALSALKKRGFEVKFLKSFMDYKSCGCNQELLPGCQQYFYTYFIIPYISNLSVNYSPDYKSLSLMVEGGSQKTLKPMTDSVVRAIKKSCQNDLYEVDNTVYTRRVSLNIDRECMDTYLSELGIPYEMDLSKLRISASLYKNYSEVVVTPMFCPICESVEGTDMDDLPFLLSERFIRDHCENIIGSLKENGFDVVQNNIIIGTAGNNGARKG